MSPATPAPTPTSPDEKPGFDQVLDRLRQIVARLEQGNLPLEQALHAFEEGVQLSRAGSAILDAAELRVEALVRGEDGGDVVKPIPASSLPGGPTP
jgi:exodeoxyribonuclease VII small subunit